MAPLSRRHFIGSTAGTALAAVVLPGQTEAAQSQAAGRLRVQFAPGGHTSPLQMYAMFESALFQDLETVVLPHPDAFDRVGTPDAAHVIVTNDWITGQWPQKEQQNMRRHVEAGGGVVVLHHAVGSNNGTTTAPGWKWWSEEVMGCYLYNPNVPGVKTWARLKQFPAQTISPAGDHPIVRGIEPFELPWDETFPNMWISPKATVLFTSDNPSFNNPAVGWVGPPLPHGRCVCLQPGHTAIVCQDPPTGRSSTTQFCGGREAVVIQIPSPHGPPNQTPRFGKTELWVQRTTGGEPYPPSFQDLFLDPMFIGMEIWAIDQPASFTALQPPSAGNGGGGPAATSGCRDDG